MVLDLQEQEGSGEMALIMKKYRKFAILDSQYRSKYRRTKKRNIFLECKRRLTRVASVVLGSGLM